MDELSTATPGVGLRVVVTGATGNVGTSLLHALAHEPAVREVVGIARRLPRLPFPKTRFVAADVGSDDLVRLFAGADVVVHLAWLIQPSHDLAALERTNLEGSRRVFEAAGRAGVGALVYASSVGAYSPGPKHERVDESWPTEGMESSFYSRHKVMTERMLDGVERRYPLMRVVRLRPALIFKRGAASGIRRLFMGPLAPSGLLAPGRIPAVPDIDGRLVLQCVHSLDVGEAYRLACVRPVRGAFNIATEPVLDTNRLVELLDSRRLPLPARLARALAAITWRLHLQPTPAGWLDLALGSPLLDTTRAREVLGWEPRFDAGAALLELLAGIRGGDGIDTPPLRPHAGGGRLGELATGVGEVGVGAEPRPRPRHR